MKLRVFFVHAILLVAIVTLSVVDVGCGANSDCTGCSRPSKLDQTLTLTQRVDQNLYDPGFAAAYERVRTDSVRLQVAEDADPNLPGTGDHEFILTGPQGAGVNVEDVFVGYLNGQQIYWKRGWGSIFGDVSFRFRGNEGDVLRVMSYK